MSLDAGTGHVAWTRDLHAHLESSPLVVGKTIYLGTDSGQLLALRTGDGSERWKLTVPAAIKASPSYDRGHVFVADYQSTMFAVDAKNGHVAWRTNTSREAPFGRGGFYSSPAISGGRVFAARDDGQVCAFDEKTGKLDWSFPTGAATYGSPAVAKVPGTQPEPSTSAPKTAPSTRLTPVTVRSVGTTTSAARSPAPRPSSPIRYSPRASSHPQGGRLQRHTHKQDFSITTAGYTPLVSDGRQLVTGYYTFVALKPKGR